MEVVGTAGVLRIGRPFKTDEQSGLSLLRGDSVESLPCAADAAYTGEIADMECAALDGRPPRVSLAESRRTVKTIAALYESARSGRSRSREWLRRARRLLTRRSPMCGSAVSRGPQSCIPLPRRCVWRRYCWNTRTR
jgi:hypothetical protein